MGLLALARPGEGQEPGCTIRKEAASGRGSCVELTISAPPFELAACGELPGMRCEVPTQVADEMLLALDEAATNAILHGSSGGDLIEVAIRVRDGWVEAIVLDHGLTKPPRPLSTTDRLSGGGWGCGCFAGSTRPLERVERGTRVTLQQDPAPERGHWGGVAPAGSSRGQLRRFGGPAEACRQGLVANRGAARGPRP